MIKTLKNQRGAILVLFALLTVVLIGFAALAMDVGYWYLVKVELSKSVDAGAIAGAKNISNPYVDPLALAEQVAQENFPVGHLGTSTSGAGVATFTASKDDTTHQIRLTGSVNPNIFLARVFGLNQITASSSGVAQKNEVEIMLVLDRSGSMDGTKMSDLKTAARSFVSFFEETQDKDKMGLVSFSTTARVDRALGTNYVTAINTSITNMSATGGTITEDAVERSGDEANGGLTDQSGVPGDQRVQQYVIFFSDGMPTALRDQFRYNSTGYDGVVVGQGPSGHQNCRSSDVSYMSIASTLYNPSSGSSYSGVNPATTGDGLDINSTSCRNQQQNCYNVNRCSSCPQGYTCSRQGNRYRCCYNQLVGYLNTKWYIFEADRLGPVSGYTAESCSIPEDDLVPYFCDACKQLALDNAALLKNTTTRNIKIYCVGLGTSTQIDETFLTNLSSGSDYTYITPDSSELEAIFNKIAKEITLRLVR